MSQSTLFKALGDPTRLRMLNLLFEEPLCVCSIEQVLGLSQPAASRHLATLRGAGILRAERRAQWVYYAIAEEFEREHGELLGYTRHRCSLDSRMQADIETLRRHVREETLCALPYHTSAQREAPILGAETIPRRNE